MLKCFYRAGEVGSDFTEECHSHAGGNFEFGHPITRGLFIYLGASGPAEEDLAAIHQF